MSTAQPDASGPLPPYAAADQQFARFVDQLGGWAGSFPGWAPADEIAGLWPEVASRLAVSVAELGRPLVVGVLGGTGTGKSTLVNALAGRDVTEASDIARPTTIHPVVVAADEADLTWFPVNEIGASVVRTKAEAVADIVLIDCPDPDTQPAIDTGLQESGPREPSPEAAKASEDRHRGRVGNRDRLEQILPRCDVLLVVSTAQKYRSFSVATELLAFAPGRPLLFVQTHASRDPDIRDDWTRDLQQQGFAVPTIYRVDGLEAFRQLTGGEPVDEGFAELQTAIAHELASREAGRIRRNGGLELAGWFLDRSREHLEPVREAVQELRAGVDRETQRLETLVADGIARQVTQARVGWRHLVANELQQQWHAGCFGWFLQFVATVASWLPRSRRQLSGIVGRALAGQVPSLTVASSDSAGGSHDRLEEALGLDDAEVEQSRSVLAGLARRAAIQTPLIQAARPASDNRDGPVAESLERGQRWLTAGIKQIASRCRERAADRWLQLASEVLFDAVLVAVLARAAWDFFHGRLWLGEARGGLLLEALVWLVLWGLLLKQAAVSWGTRRIGRDIDSLAESLQQAQLVTPLLTDIRSAATAAAAFVQQREQLEATWSTCAGEASSSPMLAHLKRNSTPRT
jgi:hypothetical protein